MDRFLKSLWSRKFLLALVAGVLIVLNDGLGWNINSETVMQFVYVILGWIFAETAVDIKRAK